MARRVSPSHAHTHAHSKNVEENQLPPPFFFFPRVIHVTQHFLVIILGTAVRKFVSVSLHNVIFRDKPDVFFCDEWLSLLKKSYLVVRAKRGERVSADVCVKEKNSPVAFRANKPWCVCWPLSSPLQLLKSLPWAISPAYTVVHFKQRTSINTSSVPHASLRFCGYFVGRARRDERCWKCGV